MHPRSAALLALTLLVSGAAGLSGCASSAPTAVAATFTLGGTVTGLVGSGLVLANNGGGDLPVDADGAFTFSAPVSVGSTYSVTVKDQPISPWQTCTVAKGSGSIGQNVTDVAVTCATNNYSVGGTVTGLTGSGLVLQNNGDDDVKVAQSGSFSFPTKLASDQSYSVTVKAQPGSPVQICSVSRGAGAVTGADVNDVTVTCATSGFTVGGTVTGLMGSGLTLQDNGGDTLVIGSDGSFTFPTPVASGAPYTVTISAQPASPPQVCTLAGGAGTVGSANITTVAVTCETDQYPVGGTVVGLAGTGLSLSLNGGETLPLTKNGGFIFPQQVAASSSYTVTLVNQPTGPAQTCTLDGGTGVAGPGSIAAVQVSCATDTFRVGGTITGLTGSGLVLQDNGGDNLTIASMGTFTFSTPVLSGQAYDVTVLSQPGSPGQVCAVMNGSGLVAGADVTSVSIVCATNTYTLGGTVSGLNGSLVLSDSGGDSLTVTGNGPFTFKTPLPSGAAYVVSVATQPAMPAQTCVVTDGTGLVEASNVVSVQVLCQTNRYAISGTVLGLTGSGLVLQDNNGDNLMMGPGASAFTFATPVASGGHYAVTVLTQPSNPSQSCVVSNGSGTVGSADLTSVTVTCTTSTFTIGGTVSGLGSATGLVLQNSGGDPLSVSGDGTFTFDAAVASGDNYLVTVQTQPTSPWETCRVSLGAGTVQAANVNNVAVTCVPNEYRVRATVTGLDGSGLVLQDNGTDSLPITSNETATFATQIASGQSYDVTIAAQPGSPSQTCTAALPTGVVANMDVEVEVQCVNNKVTVGGNLSGLTAGSSLVIEDNGGDDLTLSGDGAFVFATPVASGSPYAVTVKAASQVDDCTVTNGSGTTGSADITNVSITCVPRALENPVSGTNLMTVNRGSTWSDIFSDPSTGKVYWANGYAGVSTIYEYPDFSSFTTRSSERVINLSQAYAGTYKAALNGYFYYNGWLNNTLYKVSIATGAVVNSAPLSLAGYNSQSTFNWGGYSDIDFYADVGNALYVIWATPGGGNMIVSTVDPNTLLTGQSWTIPRPKNSTGFAFIANGVVYIGNTYNSPQINETYTLANSLYQTYSNSLTPSPGGDDVGSVYWDPVANILYECSDAYYFAYPNALR